MAYLSIDDYSKKTGISRDEILQGIEDVFKVLRG